MYSYNQDRHKNVFTISRCALPSSCNMIFHWLFSSLYKLHFPDSIRERVRLIIFGDQNKFSQIDSSIKLGIFPNATRACCAWNIIDCGWTKRKPSTQLCQHDPSVTNFNFSFLSKKINEFSKVLKNWRYSFADQKCETQHKYNVSKEMLKQYVQLEKNTFGNYLCNHVMKFLEENVFPHESEMCFYLRKELPIYDASMTTPQEGHHNSI